MTLGAGLPAKCEVRKPGDANGPSQLDRMIRLSGNARKLLKFRNVQRKIPDWTMAYPENPGTRAASVRGMRQVAHNLGDTLYLTHRRTFPK